MQIKDLHRPPGFGFGFGLVCLFSFRIWGFVVVVGGVCVWWAFFFRRIQ